MKRQIVRDNIGVEMGGPFAGGGQPDAATGAGGGGHQAGAKKPLQIEDEIKLGHSQQPGEPQGRQRRDGRRDAAIERQRRVQIGMPAEQRFVSCG